MLMRVYRIWNQDRFNSDLQVMLLATMIILKGKFDVVCTVHRNQLYKQTNKMHFLYVFILQFM